MNRTKPEILAPAGDANSFLSALAAGADAIYAGLKHFSARMEAANFSIAELSALTSLARDKGCRTYVAMNTLLKPGDLDAAGRIVDRLSRKVGPDALIVQDAAMVELAAQAGYKGELHLSTLANASHQKALAAAKSLGVHRLVLPRELNLDEIKSMSEACPDGLLLETFIHGALCFCVSGRCWWSSYLGGKSGLRGRCVQPCRRLYRSGGPKSKPERHFSCQDLSLDVLVKTLLDTDKISAWKIEGRKKGPHYVFYTVRAYQLLRDHHFDPQAKKDAEDLLSRALGRPSTHSVFLPQRPFQPVGTGGETASGLFIGNIKGGKGKVHFQPREQLLPGDLVRIGYEDDPWHRTMPIRKGIPKRGSLTIPKGKGRPPIPGAPVFLVDRREKELESLVAGLGMQLEAKPKEEAKPSTFSPRLPRPSRGRTRPMDIHLNRIPPKGRQQGIQALWLEAASLKALSGQGPARTWWFLPPVIWPGEEDRWQSLVKQAVARKAKTFVLGAPWQAALFQGARGVELLAGPFCNCANGLSFEAISRLGVKGGFVAPELAEEDFTALPGQSAFPIGVVIKGAWPFGVSRYEPGIKPRSVFFSPKGEPAWTVRYGENLWLYPGWPMDLEPHRKQLEQAGYVYFLHIHEPRPRAVPAPVRSSSFNWSLTLY